MSHDFDDILIILETGKWNLLYFVGASVGTFWLPSVIIASTFVSPQTDFFCAENETDVEIINDCHVLRNTTVRKCMKWQYNQTDDAATLTSQFNLVCDKNYLRPVYQMAYMLGNVVGAPISGILSDKFGRRKIILYTIILGVFSVLIAFVLPSIELIIVARFFSGLFFHSNLLCTYTLFMEVCEPKLRSALGVLYTVPWAFGTMWWGCIGYFIRNWKWLQAAALAPVSISFICFILYDESPRWLIVNGHHKSALAIIKKAAKWNGKTLPTDDSLLDMMKRIKETSVSCSQMSGTAKLTTVAYMKVKLKQMWKLLIILFKTSAIRRVTLLMYFTFFVAGFVYYGLSLNAANFNLNPYMYIVVVGATQLPAYVFTGFIINRFGRTYPTAITYLLCGLTVLLLAFLPDDPKYVVILFAIIGNTCIASAFQIVYLLGTEIFPTEVRSQGFGTSSFLSSVGGGTAPFVTEFLGSKLSWLPALFFGLLSVSAGIVSFFIPETLNCHLPETVEELEQTRNRHSVTNRTSIRKT